MNSKYELSDSDISKLDDLRSICEEDDLLDLEAYDSISRNTRIGNAWDALKIISNMREQQKQRSLSTLHK